MGKTKNPLLAGMLLLIVTLSLCITGISAYFLATQTIENPVSIGNNEIQINEEFKNPDIEPGEITEITKKVSITNTGINPAGVRVKAEFSSSDVLDWADIDYNTSDWEQSGDYWYYKSPLLPRESTTPLFTKITCTNPTAEQVKDFDVYVYAESRNCDENATLSVIKSLFNE